MSTSLIAVYRAFCQIPCCSREFSHSETNNASYNLVTQLGSHFVLLCHETNKTYQMPTTQSYNTQICNINLKTFPRMFTVLFERYNPGHWFSPAPPGTVHYSGIKSYSGLDLAVIFHWNRYTRFGIKE